MRNIAKYLVFVLCLFSLDALAYSPVPNCPDTTGNHLNYLTATNAYLCGTSGGGTGTVTSVIAGTGLTGGTITTTGTIAIGTTTVTAASYTNTNLTVNAQGQITAASNGSGGASGLSIGTTTITGGTNTRVLYDNSGVVGEYTVTGTGTVSVLSASPTLTGTITYGAGPALISSPAAATHQLGDADAAAPVAQTIQAQNVVAGTSNTVGTALTINGSRGTGTGVGGSLIFKTSAAGSTGTTQNALTTALTIDSTQKLNGNGSNAIGGFLSITSQGGSSLANGIASAAGVTLVASNALSFGSNKATFVSGTGNGDLQLTNSSNTNIAFFSTPANAVWQHGALDAAAPVAQTVQVQSVVTGTTNTAGADWTIGGSKGTGTGIGGSLLFKTAPAGSTGSAQNALATALTIDSTKLATFAGAISVTGHTTFEGITSTGATGTGNIVYSISPTFTSVPVAPTAAAGTATTQLATTAFVMAASQAYKITPFTASGTFTTSSSSSSSTIYRARILGAGGGGGGANGAAASGGGGGAGGYAEFSFTGIGASTGITITIGAAGTAGTTLGASGGTGGTNTIGTPVSVSCTGGIGGTGSTAATSGINAGGAGGTCSGSPAFTAAGESGSNGNGLSGAILLSGNGANSEFGGGGDGASGNGAIGANPGACSGYGSGGGGGVAAVNAGTAGCVGAVIIEQMTP